MKKNIYTVGQVNAYIKNMFGMDMILPGLSIRGEISNCTFHQSGHIYFTLKDESGSLSGIMYARDKKGLAFPMKNGDKVIVTGRMDVYMKGGRYQICARKIEREGEGDIYLRLEALKRQLEEMGMFAPEYKRPIPAYARRVGIVTAPKGAAVRDILNIAARRNPYVQLILYPALVQGEGASESIVDGIRALDELGVDVIIVGRGGGAVEDLWAFNNEQVARAIFDCRTPVISAVGHETNWSVADLVADHREPTPTAAAQAAVFDYAATLQQLRQCRERMEILVRRRLEQDEQRLQLLRARLENVSPAARLNEQIQQLADLESALQRGMEKLLTERKHRLQLLAGRLHGASPAGKLAQGFSHVADERGKTIKSVEQVKPGQHLVISVRDGRMTASVDTIEHRRYSKHMK